MVQEESLFIWSMILREIQCAICSDQSEYRILYPENFDYQALNENIYSARRIPDRCHYKIVRCNKCGLVFSTPILEAEEIEGLYKRSQFTYESITWGLRKTYGSYLKRIENLVLSKERLLEIGCGNGFFLEEARKLGYANIYGIEPSSEAIKEALPDIAENITNDMFTLGYYEESFFDVICCFQTLDHIIDPNEFLKLCHYHLKEGGIALFITHNIDALSSKIMREKCPMIDIEHIYLFNKITLKKIFEKNGFSGIQVFNVANTFPLWYYIQMLPLPKHMKSGVNSIISRLALKDKHLTLKLGNIGIVAKK